MKKKTKKQAGVLMPVSALPSPYGVGDFGKYAYEFVDLLAEASVKVWQILPLNPLGFGNSPYQPYSSMAGDELYIDLQELANQGLIQSKLPKALSQTEQVSYEEVRKTKEKFLKEAFSAFKPDAAYKRFVKQKWVRSYAVFLTIKKKNNLICWLDWPEEQKEWPAGSGFDETIWEEEISYEMFVQYTFARQWKALKTYANKKGIRIMGDIPFYVGIDSLDVWSCRKDFLLEADGKPSFIAGVPPDYFSATGQRWGNPIYDWEQMEKENFSFWLDRISYTASLFDIIRIDHFRAFDTYWKIQASCPTAIEGEWIEAPGYKLFDTLFAKYPKLNIVAEDLGLLREEVYTLRDHYKLPGMDVVLFNFDPKKGDTHHCDRMITYTGTHDNETVKQWFQAKPEKEKQQIRRYLKKQGIDTRNISHAFVTYAMERPAELTIVPVSDILGLGEEGRINTPGTLGSPDWCFRIQDYKKLKKQLPFLKKVIQDSGRG